MRNSTLSFEVMPPRVSGVISDGLDEKEAKFWDLIKRLSAFHPEFLSITYGAGGGDRYTSLDSIKQIVNDTPILPMTHLTCIDTPKSEVENVANSFIKQGVRMFLALRGDPLVESTKDTADGQTNTNAGISEDDRVVDTASLTYLLRSLDKRHQRMSNSAKFKNIARPLVISVAAFPDGNPALGTSMSQEVDRLLEKQDAGADFAITQLYYSAKVFDNFMNLARKRGVSIPIIAGVSPIWSLSRLEKCEKHIGVKPDETLVRLLSNAWDDSEREKIGLEFWSNICLEAVNSGAPGAHFFTFNNAINSEKLANKLGDF